jgi:hypothetical protein
MPADTAGRRRSRRTTRAPTVRDLDTDATQLGVEPLNLRDEQVDVLRLDQERGVEDVGAAPARQLGGLRSVVMHVDGERRQPLADALAVGRRLEPRLLARAVLLAQKPQIAPPGAGPGRRVRQIGSPRRGGRGSGVGEDLDTELHSAGEPVEEGVEPRVLRAQRLVQRPVTPVDGGQPERDGDGAGERGGNHGVVGAGDLLDVRQPLEPRPPDGLIELGPSQIADDGDDVAMVDDTDSRAVHSSDAGQRHRVKRAGAEFHACGVGPEPGHEPLGVPRSTLLDRFGHALAELEPVLLAATTRRP